MSKDLISNPSFGGLIPSECKSRQSTKGIIMSEKESKKETKVEAKTEVKAPVKAAELKAKVSMSVDGCHLIAGEVCPVLTEDVKKELTKLFGSLDKVIG